MPLEDEARRLTETIESLKTTIDKGITLRDELDRLTNRSIVNRRLIIFVIVLTVISLFVTVGVIFTLVRQQINSDRIDQIVKVQHDSALCPLYKLFLNVDTPQANAMAQRRGDDMAVRAEQFRIIRQSYAALKCDG